jgi:hypothetical protein
MSREKQATHKDKTVADAMGAVGKDYVLAYRMQRRALLRDWPHLGPGERKRRSEALAEAAWAAGVPVGLDLPDGAA